MSGWWVAVVGVVAGAAAIRWRPRSDGPPEVVEGVAPDAGLPLPADLVAALDEVWREHARDADPLLRARLWVLVDRRVPVRGVRRAPGGRAARVLFADGTVLVCRGHGPADLGRLLLAARHESVRLVSYAPADAGTHLSFCWAASTGVTVTAMGLDQPD